VVQSETFGWDRPYPPGVHGSTGAGYFWPLVYERCAAVRSARPLVIDRAGASSQRPAPVSSPSGNSGEGDLCAF
jgi:hypothetical protein